MWEPSEKREKKLMIISPDSMSLYSLFQEIYYQKKQ